NEKTLKRIKGDYYSINFDYVSLHKCEKALKKEVMKILNILFNKENPTKPLIIGLGNSSIPCDTLGVNTTNKVMATNHFNDFLNIPKVALFNPEVTEKTGISSFSLIEMVVKRLQPTVIIMIDSLATNNELYLNNCLEINNTGIIPGSAIKDNKKIDAKTFGIPVIAIGVPLVLEKDKNLYTTPNVGEIINITSKIISDALNDLFF
ncbi:MAG: GPR endopeptidase, partial [Ruminococcus sp.]|nr:GPR endopeptidase [Ruminococcus sp.]